MFVSSVMVEFQRERQAVATVVSGFGAQPVLFEDFGGRDADPENAYLGEVEASDIYLGLIGAKYGRLLAPSRFAATHKEYMHAEERGLRIAVWASQSEEREGRAHSFLEEARTFHVVPEFHSVEALCDQVSRRLREIAAQDLSPWCKLGAVVFRGSRIVDRGEELLIEALVRSDAVAHALERMRPDKWDRGWEGQFSWSGRSTPVRVAEADITTSSARSRAFTIRLERKEDRSNHIEMSIGDRTADDLTEIDVRCAVFGESNPLGRDALMFREMSDPFEVLRAQRLPDESLRPIAELLFTEALVGEGLQRG